VDPADCAGAKVGERDAEPLPRGTSSDCSRRAPPRS